ncbi:MAG TPA: hypothetical protein VMW70_02050 [Burkholderiales bacterium]|nr:hypothetical protein [Burkholderiales bacterium]
MDYRIYNVSSGEYENSAEAHVLARAYRAAWRATHGSEPTGSHQIGSLGFVMLFGGWAPAWADVSHECSAAMELAPVAVGGRDDY